MSKERLTIVQDVLIVAVQGVSNASTADELKTAKYLIKSYTKELFNIIKKIEGVVV